MLAVGEHLEVEGDPAAVVEFKAAIRAADGILIATPEYNDGIRSSGSHTKALAASSRVARAICALDRPGAGR